MTKCENHQLTKRVYSMPSNKTLKHDETPTFPTRRSSDLDVLEAAGAVRSASEFALSIDDAYHFDNNFQSGMAKIQRALAYGWPRSEEHTSELQSRENLVCRLLLEQKT